MRPWRGPRGTALLTVPSAGVEGGGLAAHCPLLRALRPTLRLRAPDLDHQGQGEGLQTAVCGVRQREAAAYHQLHGLQLQPPSPAVSGPLALTGSSALWEVRPSCLQPCLQHPGSWASVPTLVPGRGRGLWDIMSWARPGWGDRHVCRAVPCMAWVAAWSWHPTGPEVPAVGQGLEALLHCWVAALLTPGHLTPPPSCLRWVVF